MIRQVADWLKVDCIKTNWLFQKVKGQLSKEKTAHGQLCKGNWPKKDGEMVNGVLTNWIGIKKKNRMI